MLLILNSPLNFAESYLYDRSMGVVYDMDFIYHAIPNETMCGDEWWPIEIDVLLFHVMM